MAIALTVLEGTSPGIGACLLLEYEGKRLLLDCGYDDSETAGRALSFPVAAKTIDSVVLSHGHLGHCGLLPVLAREGFTGKVHCTADTGKIAVLSMLEAALLQEEERQYWVSKDQPQRGAEPLYAEREVTACETLFDACEGGRRVPVDEHMTVEFFRAGHCPGSAFLKLDLHEGNRRRRLLCIGDMGAQANDLYADSVIDDSYDSLLLPAFRADRQEAGAVEKKLGEIIRLACEGEGNVLIPISSVDRRDAILQVIRNLSVSGQIPSIFVFLDSPVASRQCEALPLESRDSPVYICLRPIDTVDDSKSLNAIRGTAIFVAGSGRGGYGRIGHHLRKNLARPETALVLFGGQPGRLLDQSLDEGHKTLSIQGQEIEIRAQIHRLEDPGVHLDANAIHEWLTRVKYMPRRVWITHGPQEAKMRFRSILQGYGIANVEVPAAGEKILA